MTNTVLKITEFSACKLNCFNTTIYVINALTCGNLRPFLWSPELHGRTLNFELPLASHLGRPLVRGVASLSFLLFCH